MKSPIFLVTLLVVIVYSSASTTGVAQSNTSVRELIGRGITDLWTWIRNRGKTEDNFIGRCFGAVKKLNTLLPIIIFKLGVIITTLGFLTIFSLKSLGLLVLLLILNSSGFIAKLAVLKHDPKEATKAQSVHFHVHQNKNGHYSVDSGGPEYEHGWVDRNSIYGSSEETEPSLADRLHKLNIYDPYSR